MIVVTPLLRKKVLLRQAREDLQQIEIFWADFGAEWGDRLSEKACEVAQLEREIENAENVT